MSHKRALKHPFNAGERKIVLASDAESATKLLQCITSLDLIEPTVNLEFTFIHA